MVDDIVKNMIETTIVMTIDKMNSVTLIDKLKSRKDETFRNTETLLYNYKLLKEHVEDESGYFNMLNKSKAGSIICYSKNKTEINIDEAMESRMLSLKRSRNDLERIEKALSKVKDRKEFKVIELRYFTKKNKDEIYSFEEIAEMLSKIEGYSDSLSEKTVRRWKSAIVKEIAIYLFGSDAI